MPHLWTGDGCEPLDTVSLLGDAKPESEDIAVTRGQIMGPDGGDFGSVQEDKLTIKFAQTGSRNEKEVGND